MLRLKTTFVCIFLFCLWVNPTFAEQKSEPICVALVTDGSSMLIDKVRDLFQKEIQDLLEGEYTITFCDEKEYSGDWTAKGIGALIDKAYSDPNIDIVISIGVISSQIISQREDFPKPSFAPFIIDDTIQNLPWNKGTSGVHNLNYLNYASNTSENLEILQKISPVHKLAIVVDESLVTNFPAFNPALREIESEYGIELEVISVSDDCESALSDLSQKKVDAVYIASISRFDDEAIDCFIKGLIDLKLPSFSRYGHWMVKRGVLATNATDLDAIRLARRIAVNVQRTLFGEDPATFEVTLETKHQLTINMETARLIGVYPPFSLLLEAYPIHAQDINPKNQINLPNAVVETLNHNLSLAVSEREVYAGREEEKISLSRLLPQLEVSTSGRTIDRDRAVGSSGREPQSAMYANANVSQILYSDRLIGDTRIQKHLQCARVEDYFSKRLDTIFDMSVAYLNLLRNMTVQSIQRNNINLTRSNLTLAEQRVEVGVARLSEVYRWESEIATNETSVVRAFYDTESARVRLNRQMNRPQNMMTEPVKVSLDDSFWLMTADWFSENITNHYELEVFKNFAVTEGLRLSPEIKQLVQSIRAQAQRLGIANRSFWSPTLAASAEVSDRYLEGGAGQKPAISLIPGVDKLDWLVGFNLSLPLYEGGAKSATQRRAFQDLMKLKLQLKDLTEEIEKQIRININRASSSFTAIGLSKKSAVSAKKNLKLVLDQYSRGTTNIVDLLDAQNQSLIAELVTANAVYDYLIDLVSVQRSIGRFDFLMNSTERDEWFRRMDAYLQQFEEK
ncbi:MAG: TolC family protein [Chlamydiota bacterium]|nr:TolC family protein [Chlamydiota bacterium]